MIHPTRSIDDSGSVCNFMKKRSISISRDTHFGMYRSYWHMSGVKLSAKSSVRQYNDCRMVHHNAYFISIVLLLLRSIIFIFIFTYSFYV